MSYSRYLRLAALWLRVKRLLRETLVKGVSWTRLNTLYAIIGDWISLTRRPRQTSESKSGEPVGVPPADDGTDSNYRLY